MANAPSFGFFPRVVANFSRPHAGGSGPQLGGVPVLPRNRIVSRLSGYPQVALDVHPDTPHHGSSQGRDVMPELQIASIAATRADSGEVQEMVTS